MSGLVVSCDLQSRAEGKIKIKLNLAEKIGVEVYANQDDFASKIQPPSWITISIVFSLLIIHEFYKYYHYVKLSSSSIIVMSRATY